MAFVAVPGSNGVWEYDDASTLLGAVAGIRTNSNGSEVYVSVRKTGEDLTGFGNSDRGELSKTYYDARI